MRVYISGPITGYEVGNKPAFDNASNHLSIRGYEVISPFDGETEEETAETLSDHYGVKYWDVLAKDVKLMSKAEGVIFLSGWESSRGARLEAYIGLLNNLPMWEFHDNNAEVYLEELKHSYVAGVCAAQWASKEILIKLGLVKDAA